MHPINACTIWHDTLMQCDNNIEFAQICWCSLHIDSRCWTFKHVIIVLKYFLDKIEVLKRCPFWSDFSALHSIYRDGFFEFSTSNRSSTQQAPSGGKNRIDMQYAGSIEKVTSIFVERTRASHTLTAVLMNWSVFIVRSWFPLDLANTNTYEAIRTRTRTRTKKKTFNQIAL